MSTTKNNGLRVEMKVNLGLELSQDYALVGLEYGRANIRFK